MRVTVLVDTNLFVRLLIGAKEGEASHLLHTAEALFRAAEREALDFTTSEAVVAEVVFALTSAYGFDRERVAVGLIQLLSSPGRVMPTRDGCTEALEVWWTTPSLSIVDALLAVTAARAGYELATLDAKLARYSTAPIWTPDLD